MDFSFIDKIIELSSLMSKPFNKQTLVDKVATELKLSKERKLYCHRNYSIRFSSAKSGYSNTFLGFQKIIDHDDKPLIACIVREDKLEFLLANSSFINCISHSSKNLLIDNIKGSANLSNIIKEFSELNNEPRNFQNLFELHTQIPQVDNIERIIEATNNIKGHVEKFKLSNEQIEEVYKIPNFMKELEKDEDFVEIMNELYNKVFELKKKILETSKTDNVNLRGNAIEQLITNDENSHDLGDIHEIINDDNIIIIDVKSKLLNSSSAPKAYNVDKLLEALTNGKTYFGYLFVGVDDKKDEVKVKLVNFLDNTIIENTKIQHHWSGINSRGTAQLNDKIKAVFDESFNSKIDLEKSKVFLKV